MFSERQSREVLKLFGGRDHNTLVKILYREMTRENVDELYKFCKENNILDDFSVAIMIKSVVDNSLIVDIEKYNKHINYKVIDYALSVDSDDNEFLPTEEVCDLYLFGMGYNLTYAESRKVLRNKFYNSIINNTRVLERLVKATELNGSMSSLVEIEDALENNHREKVSLIKK